MDWRFVSSPNSYIDTLIYKVTVFKDKAFEEIINIKWGQKNRALIL